MASKATLADVKKARVTVEIDGEEYTLIPSPDAIISLSNQYDGLAPLIGAISRMNVMAMANIVNAGLGLEGAKAREMVQSVAATPLLEISPKLTEFVTILINGGKPLKAEKAEGGDGPL
ncbi:hypothetical protein EN788_22205 [Mesorhizobium sp. M2D.F.Ca.ET.145.01.1.1]|uniref:hypothetical protein n=1 Tax=unclassified Mesorhizobium TaxID=325217 RepID=UPI000FCB34D9|nr:MULTISPECIES: hypothetical protein [unclassified Mesorhizobium]TGU44632.1 hypothetical protein EN789_21755 [bacterium M00.F.Ca.ET.146.01.1.1]TGU58460.1 hypothetical protein EN791_021755 [Mesorhizobium sp. M2D.F.Ca.ET.148.01.1.1]TGU64392.1 hypothetical protein EN790_21750 [Mesorhizobium sp. M2D.F.Ca.ET.147.01.1.1]TGW09968.1 hypothetical protein EN788_22205 [Mesorhizobium sp. M2D.F.Ca.ET.145.01.1.1]